MEICRYFHALSMPTTVSKFIKEQLFKDCVKLYFELDSLCICNIPGMDTFIYTQFKTDWTRNNSRGRFYG